MEIQHFSHDHALRYGSRFIDICYGCGDSIFEGYSCEICTGTNFGLHKSCAELPRELQQHPLHPSHPLTLLPRPPNQANFSICHECRNISLGLAFHCFECHFTFDVKCASSSEENEGKKKRIAGKALIIDHSSHHHPLTLANCRKEFRFICGGCQLPLSGPAYCCVDCAFLLHESCVDKPQEILHPFHPQHPLLPTIGMYDEYGRNCDALTLKIEVRHFSHEHALTFCTVSDKETDSICFICSNQISGPAYTCEDCNYQLHKSCSALPEVIGTHPFHSAHSLSLYLPQSWEEYDRVYFICDGCGQLSSKYRFICKLCNFSLDIKCASLTEKEVEARIKYAEVKNTILHFSHKHLLTSCNVKKGLAIICLGCKLVISGPAYACLRCGFILHETCLYDIPQEIKHPFHAHHLLPEPMSDGIIEACDACFEDIKGISFECVDCSFHLHVSCAKYQTQTIKHKFHKHELLYFGPKNVDRWCKCPYCGESCNASFFCCVVCQVDIHLECLPLPLTVKHNRHFHQLTLKDSVDDELGQYYCDICETERNPEYHVYYCEECNYVAHIDCVISEVEPPEEIYSYLIPRPKKVESIQGKIDNKTDNQTLKEEPDIAADKKLAQDRPDHDNTEGLGELDKETIQMLDEHKSFCMMSDEETDDMCFICSHEISEPAYTCEHCSYRMHKSCSALPKVIERHPFHSAHSLFLYRQEFFYEDEERYFICDGCGQLCSKYIYICNRCNFSLDIKCASLTDKEVLARKGCIDVITTILHFSHNHYITRFIVGKQFGFNCLVCKEVISGPAYVCPFCKFFLHEMCLNDIPQEIEHQFHASTSCMLTDKETDNICFICFDQISGPAYTCEDCNYQRHKSCSALPKVIEKHPLHSAHSLFLYHPDLEEDKESGESEESEESEKSYFICDGCGQLSSKYRFICKLCTFSLDIKCATLTDKQAQERIGCTDVNTTILHFSHNHLLTRCPIRKQFEINCLGCKEIISGTAYVCLYCDFFLHETCLNDMPQEIEQPFHAHHVLPVPMSDDEIVTCHACFEDIRGIRFDCVDCEFYLHVLCATYQTRAIKHEFHKHDLLYFGPKNIGRCCKCHHCGESCSTSFFCCIFCQIDIHLECLPLPLTAKHNRHFHQLTLKDSIVEDDSEQYYCDICETQRNPEHHVYYCEECNYVAHINCVISEVEPPEKILSYLVPRPKKVIEFKTVDNKTDNQILGEEPDIVADQKLARDKSDDDNTEA